MVWLVMAFETTICLPKEELKVDYGGAELIIRPATSEFYADVSVEFESGRNDLKYRKLLRRFLNALSWSYREPIYERLETGDTTHRPRVKKNHIDHCFGHLDTECIPDVGEDEDKALALSLYRSALNARSCPAAVVDLMRIFEIKLGRDSKIIRNWINENISELRSTYWENLPPHDLEAKRRLDELLRKMPDIDVGDHLYYTARCASAHAELDPNDPHNPEHNERLAEDLCIIWYLVEMYIEKELGVPSPYRERPILPSLYDCMKLSGLLNGADLSSD